MPTATIQTKQALHTLTQLHAELAGKLAGAQREVKRLRLSIFQVEAVMKLLDSGVNIRLIAPRRRRTGNPWFKRGTLYRSAVDVLRRSQVPMTARDMTDVLLKGKTPAPTRKQEKDIQAAILASMRQHDGLGVEKVGEAYPPRWRLNAAGESP